MVQIKLTDSDITFLHREYPTLVYNEGKNTISGVLAFNLNYRGICIKDNYSIEFVLVAKGNSILPIVRETKNRILRIANRKRIKHSELHLNNEKGEMCLIIPPKEKMQYPEGFNLKDFIHHIEEHLYWISYYERYEKPPWREQAHGINGYIQLYSEDYSYRPEVKKAIERELKHPVNRAELRRIIKNKNKQKK